MRAAVEQREELAVDMEHDDVAAIDLDHLVTARRNVCGAGDDVTGHASNTWNYKSVLRPILRDGHFVASSG